MLDERVDPVAAAAVDADIPTHVGDAAHPTAYNFCLQELTLWLRDKTCPTLTRTGTSSLPQSPSGGLQIVT